jgi:hypothetical protein
MTASIFHSRTVLFNIVQLWLNETDNTLDFPATPVMVLFTIATVSPWNLIAREVFAKVELLNIAFAQASQLMEVGTPMNLIKNVSMWKDKGTSFFFLLKI